MSVANAQPEGAMSPADRIIALASAPCVIDAYSVTGGASVGISTNDGENEDADFVLEAADLAMYRAKEDGGGTYRVFDPKMDAAAQAATRLRTKMRDALIARRLRAVLSTYRFDGVGAGHDL